MYKNDPTYLYKFKNSSNYYFRINLIFFQKLGYDNLSGHFVASLKTSNYQDARWLALYIKRKIEKEFDMHAVEKQRVALAHGHNEKNEGKHNIHSKAVDDVERTIALQKRLREKYNSLLKVGQLALDAGYDEESIVILSRTEIDKAFSKPINVPVDKKLPDSPTETRWLPTALDKDNIIVFSQVMSELQKRIGSFEYAADPNTALKMEDFNDFIVASVQQREVKEHALQVLKEEREAFFLKNQFELFIEEQLATVDKKTIEGYQRKFDFFFRVIDKTMDVRLFDKHHMQKVKSQLLNTKANASKGCSDKNMSVKTMNTYLSNYRTFFSWLIDHVDGVDINPFAGASISDKRASKIERRSFTFSEISQLLSYEFRHGSEARTFRTDAEWYVPVAIYTGMRLNEIAALSLKHVVKIQNIWCFDLTGVEVKNEPSNRIVPIAQYLIDEGIFEYIESIKRRKETLLFPEIRKGKSKPGKAGWGDPISRWFNRTALNNLGIDIAEEERRGTAVCFHSIRHTFISKLTDANCQGYIVKRIVGHSVNDDVTLGDYSHINKIPLRVLKNEMDKHLTWHLGDEATSHAENNWTITENAENYAMGSSC